MSRSVSCSRKTKGQPPEDNRPTDQISCGKSAENSVAFQPYVDALQINQMGCRAAILAAGSAGILARRTPGAAGMPPKPAGETPALRCRRLRVARHAPRPFYK